MGIDGQDPITPTFNEAASKEAAQEQQQQEQTKQAVVQEQGRIFQERNQPSPALTPDGGSRGMTPSAIERDAWASVFQQRDEKQKETQKQKI